MLTIITGNQRRTRRNAVLQGAQIEFGHAAFDCQVLDVSNYGVRVRTGAPLPIPERVTLRFRGGPRHPAIRRWSLGLYIGLSFGGG